MIVARAMLVAGPHHEKYASGSSLPALLFVNAPTEDGLEAVASRELAALGWTTISIERYKHVSNREQFLGKETPEASAFRDAEETGFGVVVYP